MQNNVRKKLYGFDEHKFWAVYKKIWKAKSLSEKIVYNQKPISPNWCGLKELIQEWFNKVPDVEKENAKHFICARKYQTEIQSAKSKAITSIFLSGIIPVLVMFVSIIVPYLSQKVETLDFPRKNTLYINASDLTDLHQDTKDILQKYGIKIQIIAEEKNSYFSFDGDLDSNETKEVCELLMNDGIIIYVDKHLEDKNNWIDNFEFSLLTEYVIILTVYFIVYAILDGIALEEKYKKISFYNDVLKIIDSI